MTRALRPYRVELVRDYGLKITDLDEWGIDDLLDLALDIGRRCAAGETGYRYKWR